MSTNQKILQSSFDDDYIKYKTKDAEEMSIDQRLDLLTFTGKSLMENVIFVQCQYLKVNNKYVKDYHPSTESS